MKIVYYLFVSLFCFLFSIKAVSDANLCRVATTLYYQKELKATQSYHFMKSLFLRLNTPSKELLKQLRRSIRRHKFLGRYARKQKNVQARKKEERIVVALQFVYAYLQKHKHENDAILFHKYLQDKYKPIIDEGSFVDDLVEDPNKYGVSDYLSVYTYYKKVIKDLRMASMYEDRLHSKHGFLKSLNYAFKIELIKIRNTLLYHEEFKEQKRLHKKSLSSITKSAGLVGLFGFGFLYAPYIAGAGALFAALIAL